MRAKQHLINKIRATPIGYQSNDLQNRIVPTRSIRLDPLKQTQQNFYTSERLDSVRGSDIYLPTISKRDSLDYKEIERLAGERFAKGLRRSLNLGELNIPSISKKSGNNYNISISIDNIFMQNLIRIPAKRQRYIFGDFVSFINRVR
jgi:hypothetical protein